MVSNTMNNNTTNRGWSKVFGVALLFGVLAMVPVVVGWGRIPDPFASHWGLDGQPDSWMPLWALPLLPLALIGSGLAIAGIFRGAANRPSAEGVALLSFLGTMGVSLTVSTVILNWDAGTGAGADPMRWTHLVAALVIPLVAGLIGYRAGRRWFPIVRPEPTAQPDALEIAPGETVAWTGSCQVRYPFVIAGVAALMIVVLPPPFGWFLLPLVLVGLLLSHVRVTVNETGVRARLGGVIRRMVPLGEIDRAEAIVIEPGEWGGWGYRVAPGRTAMVLRRGSAIDIHLKSGRRFAVTVDDAPTGAALINGLVTRQAHHPS